MPIIVAEMEHTCCFFLQRDSEKKQQLRFSVIALASTFDLAEYCLVSCPDPRIEGLGMGLSSASKGGG